MIRGALKALAADRRGVSAIVIALSMSALLGFAGLAIDVSIWYADKRAAQGAADSAAFSAAVDYNANASTTLAAETAKAVAAQYGFVNGSNGVTVTVNSPPHSGTHEVTGAFEVIISKNETIFFSALQHSSQSIAARAVGQVVTSGAGGPACILVEGNTASAEMYMNNGAAVALKNCGLADNGTSSSSVYLTGGASLSAASLVTVGGISTSNGATLTDTGAKVTGAAVTANPYTVTMSQAEGGVTPSCSGQVAPTAANTLTAGGKTYNITPGVYCGGIATGNGVTVNMAAGTYIMYGGYFSAQSGTLNASAGVTIVLTGSGTNYAVMDVANGNTFTLTAPTSGALAGVAVYADPNAPAPSGVLTPSSTCGTAGTNCNAFAGGVGMKITGAVDIPSQGAQFTNGSSNASSCTQLIAYSIAMAGGAQFNNSCTGVGTKQIGGTTTTVSLVE